MRLKQKRAGCSPRGKHGKSGELLLIPVCSRSILVLPNGEQFMPLVTFDDGTEYNVQSLLADGDSNFKLSKSNASGKGFLTFGLSLAPANVSGYNVCASSSPGCRAACLYSSGMGKIHAVQRCRIAKTKLFFEQRTVFLDMLYKELHAAVKKGKKDDKEIAVRLNVLSDIKWEEIQTDIFHTFESIQFYDYTKHAKRMLRWCGGTLPFNYHLTFSRSECNHDDCLKVLNAGGNVTVVFNKKELPKEWNTRKVVNGDETDLRFLDPKNVVVGLYMKGDGKKDKTGFVVNLL